MNRKERIVLSVGLFVAPPLIGCGMTQQDKWASDLRPHAHRQSLSQDACDHRRDLKKVSRHDSQALIDDWDLVFMTDRPGRLSRWHDR